MLSSEFSGPRAGFWRRSLALLIDFLLIGAVLTIVGPLAFWASSGRVQSSGVGLRTISCVGTTSIPADLDPPPPDGSNHAAVCTEGTLPSVVSKRYLLVGARTVSSGVVVDRSQRYPLSTAGFPIADTDVTWVFELGFVAYLVLSLHFTGRTWGMRLARIRMAMLPLQDGRVGVTFSRLLIRIAVAVAGFVPALAAAVWAILAADSAPKAFHVPFALAACLCWVGWNVALVARKEDPVYDSFARVAVLVEQG